MPEPSVSIQRDHACWQDGLGGGEQFEARSEQRYKMPSRNARSRRSVRHLLSSPEEPRMREISTSRHLRRPPSMFCAMRPRIRRRSRRSPRSSRASATAANRSRKQRILARTCVRASAPGWTHLHATNGPGTTPREPIDGQPRIPYRVPEVIAYSIDQARHPFAEELGNPMLSRRVQGRKRG